MSAPPRLKPLLHYILIALIGFAIADLTILSFRDEFIPRTAPKPRLVSQNSSPQVGPGFYIPIVERNIFNADGKIPDPLVGGGSREQDLPPIPGTMGFTLVGTIVHANPKKSVASLTVKNRPEPDAFMIGSDIMEGTIAVASMHGVERNRAIYRNRQSGRLEFVEIKEDAKISFAGAAPTRATGPITKKSDNEVVVSRDELNKKLADLPSLLMQARAVPRLGPDGRVQCFQMVGIQPGSVYESLNIKVGDCIKTVNGEPIDSPAKAMDLFNQLKNSASVELGIERNGSDQNLKFDVE